MGYTNNGDFCSRSWKFPQIKLWKRQQTSFLRSVRETMKVSLLFLNFARESYPTFGSNDRNKCSLSHFDDCRELDSVDFKTHTSGGCLWLWICHSGLFSGLNPGALASQAKWNTRLLWVDCVWEGWAESQERKALNDARNEERTFSGSFLQSKLWTLLHPESGGGHVGKIKMAD